MIHVLSGHGEAFRRGDRGDIRIGNRRFLANLFGSSQNLGKLLGGLNIEGQHPIVEKIEYFFDLASQVLLAFTIRQP